MNSPNVYILILNWHGWRDTIECLESVQRLDYPTYTVVVIDNNSTDGSLGKIKEWAAGKLSFESNYITCDPASKPVMWIEYDRKTAESGGLPEQEQRIMAQPPYKRMVLIQSEGNLGFAGGNNVGIRYALQNKADYVWLLNNDAVADKSALTEMVGAAEANKQVGMVGSKVLSYHQPNIIQAAAGGWFSFFKGTSYNYGWLEPDMGQWDRPFDPYYITGASLLVKEEVMRTTGFMNEAFFLYGEEMEWQMRAKHQGWKLIYCPQSRIWHKENASTGYKSPVVEYHATRNWLWITKRYAPWELPTAVSFHLLRVARRIVKGNTKQAIAVTKGIWDGIIKTYADIVSI